MVFLFLLLFLSELVEYPEVRGNFRPLNGRSHRFFVKVEEGGLWVFGRGNAFLLKESGIKEIRAKGLIYDVFHAQDNFIVATGSEIILTNKDGIRVLKNDLNILKLIEIEQKIYGLFSGQSPSPFPDLLGEIDPETLEMKERLLRMPEPAIDRGFVWIVAIGPGDWIWHWSHKPDRFYISSTLIREKEKGYGNHLLGGSLVKVFEQRASSPDPSPVTVDRGWQRQQQELARPHSLGFDKVDKGYLLAREIGVPAPGLRGDSIYIGAAVEVLVFDPTLTLRDRIVFEGTFGGIHDQGIYLVHDREKLPPLAERYRAMKGSPLERAKALLGDVGVLEERTLRPVVEKVYLLP